MDNKFELTDTDKRKQFIDAVENNKKFISQLLPHRGIILYDDEFGFYLKAREKEIDLTTANILRAYAIAKLVEKYNTILSLRELYYAILQTPELAHYFDGVQPSKLNDQVTDRINSLEIVADVDRLKFTVSTASKGYIFYPFSYSYGNQQRKIVFTEELAHKNIHRWELEDCQSILVLEKEAAVQRLIQMGFPSLTNSAIVTVSGEYSRSIFRFVYRFDDYFPIIFLADGDVYGTKMNSTIMLGSKRSSHLNLRTNKDNIYIAGLYPSVGEQINLKNDKEEKRPMENQWAKKMLGHLKHFKLVDDQDIATWERNNTYELEALSLAFTNNLNQPIGLGIYLTEYMRLNEIPVKPLPEDIKEDFDRELNEEISTQLYPDAKPEFIQEAIDQLSAMLSEPFEELEESARDDQLATHQDTIDEYIADTEEETIQTHLINQYCKDMKRKIYSFSDLWKKIIKKAETNVTYDAQLLDEIKDDITNALNDLVNTIKPKIEQLIADAEVDSELELEDLDPDLEPCDLYDKIQETIGAKPEDVEKIHTALKHRLGL